MKKLCGFLFSIFCFTNVNAEALSIKNQDKQEIIHSIVQKLNAHYLYPELAKKMSQFMETKLSKHGYDSAKNLESFSQTLNDDLFKLSKDKHLTVFYSPETLPRDALLNAAINTNDLTQEEKRKLSSDMSHYNYAFEETQVLPGNVGYLRLHIFWPLEFSSKTADAAMTFLANSGTLIIDLRSNFGGQPEMVNYLLSYFFNHSTHISDTYNPLTHITIQQWTYPIVPGTRYDDTKPVYILTSQQTFSGAEGFAYTLQSLKRALVIGEETKGGAHLIHMYRINDHLFIDVPYAEVIDPIKGKNWELTGVIPDIKVPANEAYNVAYKKGLEYNLQHTNDAQLKSIIEAQLKKHVQL